MNKIKYIFENKMFVLLFICLIGIILSFSYSSFFVISDDHRAAEMYVSELNYTININDNITNSIFIPNGTSDVTIVLSSNNGVNTKYKLSYIIDSNTDNYSIYYYDETEYNSTSGSIETNGSKTIKIRISNYEVENLKFTFKVFGGYDHNDLKSIILDNNYKEITEIAPAICTYDGTLEEGTTYTYGQYTYIYKKYNYYNVNSKTYDLRPLKEDGWSVELTNKESTNSATGKVCSSINGKPLISTASMFANSKANTIYLDKIDAKNVIDMSCMFCNAKFTDIGYLSTLYSNKVIDMSYMFYNTTEYVGELLFSSINTINVIDMSYMFYGAAAETIDISNFGLEEPVNMKYMFAECTTTSLFFLSYIPNDSVLDSMFENCGINNVYTAVYIDNPNFTQEVTKYPDTLVFTGVV